jgi:hypothetical protein
LGGEIRFDRNVGTRIEIPFPASGSEKQVEPS